jgi:hypothetical protein
MPSQVNPNLINAAFPIAGVTQPSAGFRSNFLATQQAFEQYTNEMNDVINKAVVKAPLTYGANSNINNFGGMNNSNLAIFNFAYGSFTPTANVISTSGMLSIDMSKASYFPFNLTSAGSAQVISLSNFGNIGYSEVVLDINVQTSPQYVNVASIGSSITGIGGANISGFNQATGNIALNNVGRYQLVLGSLDGINWTLDSRDKQAVARHYTPINSIGAIGDTIGQIAYDATYLYICLGNYDGFTNIWRRTSIGGIF